MRTRREFLAVLGMGALGVPLNGLAQQKARGRPPRIGFLSQVHSPSGSSENLDAFRRSLRDLGYVEGKSIRLEYRSAEGAEERVPDLVAELIRLEVDLIIVDGGTVLRAAMDATKTTPIIMMHSVDPVAAGIVRSLARPAGNVTGVVTLSPELIGKRLELLKEVSPKVSRVGVLTGRADPTTRAWLKELEGIARRLALHLLVLEVRGPNAFEPAFQAAARGEVGGLIEFPAHVFHEGARQIIDFAATRRIPAVFHTEEFVEAGGLMSYGANYPDLYRRVATYADKILKGARPAEMPIEQPTKFDLFVNGKTARALGITIPQSILVRADRVIE